MVDRITQDDVMRHASRSRHDARLAAASARAARLPVLARTAIPVALLLVPLGVDLVNAHRDPELVTPITIGPIVVALAMVVVIGVIAARRGDVQVADGGVRVSGWPRFDVSGVHEVLPISWRDHSGPRRVELAFVAADGTLLAHLDGRRYVRDELDAVLATLAGRVRPAVQAHLGAARRLRQAHPESIDHRDRTLAAAQWLATVVGLLATGAASFLTLASG